MYIVGLYLLSFQTYTQNTYTFEKYLVVSVDRKVGFFLAYCKNLRAEHFIHCIYGPILTVAFKMCKLDVSV